MHPAPRPSRPLSASIVTMARAVAGNPAAFAHEPHFAELRETAWSVLKRDHATRAAARRAATLRNAGPGDAA